VQPPPSRAHHRNITAVVELLERTREQTWYHTLELPGGEVTPAVAQAHAHAGASRAASVARHPELPPDFHDRFEAITAGDGSLAMAIGQMALYVAVMVVATWSFERPLLREVLGYLRGTRAAAPAPA
jgi:hypothetical protein